MKGKHKDARGLIEDLKVGKDWSVTYISFKKGAVRGNHWHDRTIQQDFIISGTLRIILTDKKRKMTMMDEELSAGDSVVIDAGQAHAYRAIDDAEMVSICFGERIGKNYENDVNRLDVPLL